MGRILCLSMVLLAFGGIAQAKGRAERMARMLRNVPSGSRVSHTNKPKPHMPNDSSVIRGEKLADGGVVIQTTKFKYGLRTTATMRTFKFDDQNEPVLENKVVERW
jgi:hypothetical protein